MRDVILSVAVSLDGYIEGPNGEYDWCFTDQDYGMSEFFKQVDSVFMGRKSYELVQSMGDQENTGFPKMKTYVFSRTLDAVKPEEVLVNKDIESAVREIKSQPGKDIWLFGGAGLTTSLMNLGLVDRFSLAVHPILLGAGKPMFQGIKERMMLKLLDIKSYSTGLVIMNYST